MADGARDYPSPFSVDYDYGEASGGEADGEDDNVWHRATTLRVFPTSLAAWNFGERLLRVQDARGDSRLRLLGSEDLKPGEGAFANRKFL